MTVSDNTKQDESLGDFLQNTGKKGFNVLKKMAKKRFKEPTTSFGNRSKRWLCFCISKS